jgi:flagellar hook-basal body complex protein FliE
MFENALQEVNQLQTQADQQIEGLTLKKDGVTPHTAMVALEKADVAFQLMSAIRGKIVRAYEEVMRTQV